MIDKKWEINVLQSQIAAMAGAWFKNETTQPQNIVACSRITTNGVTPFTTNNKDGKCIGDNAVVAENTIKDIAYLNTIQEKGNQKANNELKIATNSTACRDKFGDDKPIEWSIAKEEANVCQWEEVIGILQSISNDIVIVHYKDEHYPEQINSTPIALSGWKITKLQLNAIWFPADSVKGIPKGANFYDKNEYKINDNLWDRITVEYDNIKISDPSIDIILIK